MYSVYQLSIVSPDFVSVILLNAVLKTVFFIKYILKLNSFKQQ
jgi:hypothetical protein